MSNISNQKYRPVLSADQIKHILHLCRTDLTSYKGTYQESESVIATLSVFEHKIQNNAIKPAHTLIPKIDLEEKLGFSNTSEQRKMISKIDLYKRWKENPNSIRVGDISLVHEYRYESNLMSPEEMVQYENSLIFPIKES